MREVEKRLENHYHGEKLQECKGEDEKIIECIRHRVKIKSLEENEREL